MVYVGGWKYWTMTRHKPSSWVINRQLVEDDADRLRREGQPVRDAHGQIRRARHSEQRPSGSTIRGQGKVNLLPIGCARPMLLRLLEHRYDRAPSLIYNSFACTCGPRFFSDCSMVLAKI
jgi:hypothetical protein